MNRNFIGNKNIVTDWLQHIKYRNILIVQKKMRISKEYFMFKLLTYFLAFLVKAVFMGGGKGGNTL